MKKIISLLAVLVLVLAGCGAAVADDGVIRIRAGYTDNYSEDTAQLAYMRDYTGQEVEWIPGPLEGNMDKLNLELGSKEPYDIVTVGFAEMGMVLKNNLALDLSPYKDLAPNVIAAIEPEDWAMCTDPETGAVYCIPSGQSSNHIINTTIYRADILEEEGLEPPTTTDELLETTCTLAERGYSRPWAINWQSAMYDYGVRHAFGVGYEWNYDENGELVYIGNDPRYQDYLDWAKAMYDCGGYGVDYETITQEDRNASFINGDSVFMTSPWWEAQGIADGLETQGIEYEEAVAVVDLTGPTGIKSYEQEGNGAWYFSFIPTYMEESAESTVKFINQLYEEEYIIQTQYGAEGKSFEYVDGQPVRINGSDVVYPEPYTCENCGPEYYGIGEPTVITSKGKEIESEMNKEAVEAGTATPNQIATVNGDEFMEYGTVDPVAPMVIAPLWNEAEQCANDAVLNYTDLYITGRAETDYEKLQAELEACGIPAATEEVNEWADKYYAE